VQTLVAKFNVVDEAGEDTLDTEVHHHVTDSGYELFTITQQDTDSDEYLTILLHRGQLAALAAFAKGH